MFFYVTFELLTKYDWLMYALLYTSVFLIKIRTRKLDYINMNNFKKLLMFETKLLWSYQLPGKLCTNVWNYTHKDGFKNLRIKHLIKIIIMEIATYWNCLSHLFIFYN